MQSRCGSHGPARGQPNEGSPRSGLHREPGEAGDDDAPRGHTAIGGDQIVHQDHADDRQAERAIDPAHVAPADALAGARTLRINGDRSCQHQAERNREGEHPHPQTSVGGHGRHAHGQEREGVGRRPLAHIRPAAGRVGLKEEAQEERRNRDARQDNSAQIVLADEKRSKDAARSQKQCM